MNDEKSVYKGFWRKFDQTENFPEMAGKKVNAPFRFHYGNGGKDHSENGVIGSEHGGGLQNLHAEAPGHGILRTFVSRRKTNGKKNWHGSRSQPRMKQRSVFTRAFTMH